MLRFVYKACIAIFVEFTIVSVWKSHSVLCNARITLAEPYSLIQ
jgi:hypothetical protein